MKIVSNGKTLEVPSRQALDIYSLEERVVGRWIDGKPLYEKTIYVPNKTLSIGTAWQSIAPPIANLERLCIINAFVNNGPTENQNDAPLPVMTASGNVSFTYNQFVSTQPAGFIIQPNHSAFATATYTFVIRYTKTTDQPTIELPAALTAANTQTLYKAAPQSAAAATLDAGIKTEEV